MPSSSSAFSRPEAQTPSPQLGGPLLPNRPNTSRTNSQTPQRRKPTASVRFQSIKSFMPHYLSLSSIAQRLVSRLTLQYTPDDWQVHLIHRILQGYDSIFCAGAGYDKCLIFEGLAVLGGTGKLCHRKFRDPSSSRIGSSSQSDPSSSSVGAVPFLAAR